MPHLVDSQIEDFDLQTYLGELRQAHAFLAKQGQETSARIAATLIDDSWGQRVKREPVRLPDLDRPGLMLNAPKKHSITEIYNQCANLERLMDAITWLLAPSSGFHIRRGLVCHPTTSSGSGKSSSDDNDLVVELDSGEVARFEVTDIASTSDGNFKEGKSLVRLGVLKDVKRGQFNVDGIEWPKDRRLFLVVSDEFATHLRNSPRWWLKGDQPHCHYEEVKKTGTTRVFEVKPGGSQ